MGVGKSKTKNNSNINKIYNEYVFPGPGVHIPDERLKIIKYQREKSICKIIINKESKGIGYGTGFLCEIGEYNKKCLITAYHVLGEDLKIGNEIKITFNDNEKSEIIKTDSEREIYANKNEDIIIMEILDSDNLKNYHTLEIEENINNNNIDFYNEYNNKPIYILHYPNGNFSTFSSNNIVDIDKNNNIYHLCSTEGGSSGAPILNLDNLKVIGIHRGYDFFDKKIFHEEIILKYQNKFNNENRFKCNIGKILKESLVNFIQKTNKIILTVKICKDDINKKIYFVQNYDEIY